MTDSHAAVIDIITLLPFPFPEHSLRGGDERQWSTRQWQQARIESRQRHQVGSRLRRPAYTRPHPVTRDPVGRRA